MGKHLVIVESPAKARTITKYLGRNYKVLSSYGHMRDLLPKTGSVDPEHDFAMKYEVIEKNAKHVSAIAKALKTADALYLATDPDREGEAIAWHVQELMKEQGLLEDKPVHRVVFHEITKTAIQAAIDDPRTISSEMVNSQQARRALDYLVGFNLSPLLWKKVRRGLSAGRVQSPALRLIVERELEIEKFEPKEYWSILADAKVKKDPLSARLVTYQGDKVEQFTVTDEKTAEKYKKTLLKEANGKLVVDAVTKKQRKRNPSAPFITSTLQQEASRKLGFTTQRTMRIAQQLYEGIDIGGETVGLITYMRTDSVNLADEAVEELREMITKRYGKENVPDQPKIYKTKSKNAQEAHEAIRPTRSKRIPNTLKDHLKPEQLKLYELIWKRTVASQMIHATLNTVSIDLLAGETSVFRANGSTIANPGFMAVYLEGVDDEKKADNDEKLLPPLKKGEEIDLLDIQCEQHFTEPPPRYSEATLIKALVEYDIGRPSTYSSIISTLQQREYATLEKKRFFPTDVARVVNKFLTEHFNRYVDYGFTAALEDDLDAVARGEKKWIPLLRDFWKPFVTQIKSIDETVKREDVTSEKLDEQCPKCSKPVSIRLGRRGRFIGCTGYPDCDYTRNVDGETSESTEPEVVEGRVCEKCSSPLVIKFGRYGKFIGCSNYPTCKHMEPLEKPSDTKIACPVCHKGNMLKRKSRRGKIFFSCATYPTCEYAIWNEPVEEPCPKCSWPIVSLKTTKRRGTEKVCPQKECDFAEVIEPPEGQSDKAG